MCLVQNVQKSSILTKSPTQKSAVFDPTKIQNLSTLFERPYTEQLKAYFSFEIGYC